MPQPAFDYSRTYAEMSDNELLAIAGDSTSLTREALAALQAEIEKRHLSERPQQAEDQQPAADNYLAWRARLESKLNSPRMTFLLPPWQSAEADEDLRILLGNQVVGGWIAVFASQFIIGGLFWFYYVWVTGRLTPLHSSSHLGQVLATWMPIDVALMLVYISAGLALWNKWSFAVKLARVAFVGTALNTITLWAVVALVGFLSRPAASVLSGSGPLLAPDVNLSLRQAAPLSCLSILYGVAGLLYLSRSRRVRLTYSDGSAWSEISPARPNSECNHVK